jgi:quercetin dioxygenase-like cupin family protein
VYPTTGAQVSSVIITLLPGQQTGWHRHDAPMYAYILSGAVTVTYDGGVTKTYSKGQAIMEAVGTRHNGVNKGEDPVRILVVNIGGAGVANSVKL